MSDLNDKKIGPVFSAGAEGRQVPVESTFLAAAPCNAPLPEEYLRAMDLNEDAWRRAMEDMPSLRWS